MAAVEGPKPVELGARRERERRGLSIASDPKETESRHAVGVDYRLRLDPRLWAG